MTCEAKFSKEKLVLKVVQIMKSIPRVQESIPRILQLELSPLDKSETICNGIVIMTKYDEIKQYIPSETDLFPKKAFNTSWFGS